MSLGSCRVSSRKIRSLEDAFTDLHEGRAVGSVTCESYPSPALPLQKLGQVTEIQYRKIVTDGGYPYHHPFALHAQPTVGLDRLGIPVFWAGRYTVTTHGIEDRPASRVRPERLPGVPTALTQLGTLEFIRYASREYGVLRVKTLRFKGLTLEHDSQGNLHVLQVPRKHGVPHMARKHHKRRHNPLSLTGGELTKVAYPALAAGTVGAISIELMNRLLSAKNASTGLPRLAGYKKAGAEIAAGLVGAFVLSKVKAPAEIVVGFGAGVTSLGLLDGFHQWNTQRLMSTSAPQTTTSPGAYAIGPGGLPRGYYGVNRAGCAVGARR